MNEETNAEKVQHEYYAISAEADMCVQVIPIHIEADEYHKLKRL